MRYDVFTYVTFRVFVRGINVATRTIALNNAKNYCHVTIVLTYDTNVIVTHKSIHWML